MTGSSEYLRFRWDHTHPLHRALVRVFNAIVAVVPFSLKYGIGSWTRRNKLPYQLVQPSDTVVQIGAPADTLRAGRSRAMYFARSTRQSGRTVVIEPDMRSCEVWENTLAEQGFDHVTVINKAAWSDSTMIKIYTDDRHPATNFTGGTVDYGPDRLADYDVTEIEAVSVDDLCASLELDEVSMLSITTNGAETEILNGARQLIAAGLRYVALARTGPGYIEHMATLGFELIGHDDRGYTFERRADG